MLKGFVCFTQTRTMKLALDLVVLAVVFCAAFGIRFDGDFSWGHLRIMMLSVPFVLLIQALSLSCFLVPAQIWRYVSFLEIRRIFLSLLLASTLLAFLNWLGAFSGAAVLLPFSNIPRGVLIIDFALALLAIIGLRGVVRLWHERSKTKMSFGNNKKIIPTLLIGAGSAGAGVAKVIGICPELRIQPVGFLDDDPLKKGMLISGTRVLGPIADFVSVVRKYGVRQAIITLGSPRADLVRHIFHLGGICGIPTKVIPGIEDMIAGKVKAGSIRDVAIEDLLRRPPVTLDEEEIASLVLGRTIMISGAGGSIGSELCRTICRFCPQVLLLVDQTENNLFNIHRELIHDFPDIQIIPRVADMKDLPRLEHLFATFHPDVVLHAAAHKHVPMMEWNPGEAIKNNVVGTRNITDLAHEYGVSEFVMISTDKAVNPSSIMGVSKRLAELYIQALSRQSRTRFVTVRFGNVLGSAGSVIPIFKEQIAKGGPVTVTHPDMKRFFMTIPEACQLVLQAASMGKGGEVFILDMGEPVRIVDLARDLIRLSGFSTEEIEIRFTGIRPGEKLFEELSLTEEIVNKTRHPNIFIGQSVPCEWEEINQDIDELRELADCGDADLILSKIKLIVPEFCNAHRPAKETISDRALLRADTEHGVPLPKHNGHLILPEPQAP